MDFLALILGAVLSGNTIVEYGKQPLDLPLVEQHSTETIHHSGFSFEDPRQAIIQKAYDLGGIEFVLMLECENGNWSIDGRGDRGHAWGLCQMNDKYHNIPKEYFEDREYQLEYCYQKWKWGTKFYWPKRKIKGQYCKDYVRDRFTITS